MLKWEGYPPSENTWENEENLTNCEELIAEFEKTHSLNRKRKNASVQPNIVISKKKARTNTEVGFEHGHQVEAILGAKKEGGQLFLYVSWKEVDEATFIPASVAHVKIPQMLIEFYESRIKWERRDSDGALADSES